MKNVIRVLVVAGALAGASFATAAPASAACWNNEVTPAHMPTICVFYDNCDADICIGKPKLDG